MERETEKVAEDDPVGALVGHREGVVGPRLQRCLHQVGEACHRSFLEFAEALSFRKAKLHQVGLSLSVFAGIAFLDLGPAEAVPQA